jgi:DNA-directed RNA polymerase subunit L
MFVKWLDVAKKASAVEKGSERYNELRREFNTMQIKRCFKINEKNEPFSFDFTVETAGVLPVQYIVKRACEVGENMCSRYVNIHHGDLPEEITISSADTRIIGYDFLIRGHDHTLGNLLQTWLVENHIQGEATPKVTYAGYSVPHPLRDEIILRIGVEDGEEATARLALAEAAKGCVDMFQKLRIAWQGATGAPVAPSIAVRRNRPKVAQPKIG